MTLFLYLTNLNKQAQEILTTYKIGIFYLECDKRWWLWWQSKEERKDKFSGKDA